MSSNLKKGVKLRAGPCKPIKLRKKGVNLRARSCKSIVSFIPSLAISGAVAESLLAVDGVFQPFPEALGLGLTQ
jgi:hypothetical protein